MKASIATTIASVVIVVSLKWLPPRIDTKSKIWEEYYIPWGMQIRRLCNEWFTLTNVVKGVFSSVETQTVFTWIEDTDKPTRLTDNPKKIIIPSRKHQLLHKQPTLQKQLTLQLRRHTQLKCFQQ